MNKKPFFISAKTKQEKNKIQKKTFLEEINYKALIEDSTLATEMLDFFFRLVHSQLFYVPSGFFQ